MKQSGLAKGLRESFARLDLQHQEKHRHRHRHHRHKTPEQEQEQDQGQGRPEVVPVARDPDTGGDEEKEEGGRTRPIDVETSMSVR